MKEQITKIAQKGKEKIKEQREKRGATRFFISLLFLSLLFISLVLTYFQSIFWGFFVFWLILWVRIVPRDKVGIALFFEKPLFFCGSGPHILPWIFKLSYIHLLPKTRFELSYQPRIVISKSGKWGKEKGQKSGKQFLIVVCTVYTEFARNFGALVNVIERGVPTDQTGLTDYTDSLIDSSLRLSMGDMTWVQATEKDGREVIENGLNDQIKKENSLFMLSGFNTRKTEIALKTVDLQSEDLKAALVQPDKQRLQAAGAPYEAERAAVEAETILKIREKMREAGIPKDKVNELAVEAFKIQTAKDVSMETGTDAFRVIKFETIPGSSSLSSLIAEGAAAFSTMVKESSSRTPKTSIKPKGTELDSESKIKPEQTRVKPKKKPITEMTTREKKQQLKKLKKRKKEREKEK